MSNRAARRVLLSLLFLVLCVTSDNLLPGDRVAKFCFLLGIFLMLLSIEKLENPEVNVQHFLFFNFRKPPDDDKNGFVKNLTLEV